MAESGGSRADTIRAAILGGLPVDPDVARRVGDRDLTEVLRRILAERADLGAERLIGLVRSDPGRTGELAAEVLGKWGGSEIGPLLKAIDVAGVGKQRRKAIRRGIHFLESRHGGGGEGGERSVRPPAATSHRTAFLNAPTWFGGRVWLFRRAEPDGRSGRLAVVAVSDRRGVRDFSWQDGSDAAFDRYRRRVADQGAVLAVVPWDHLRGRLLRLEERNTVEQRPLPPNYGVLREWLALDELAGAELRHPATPEVGVLEIRQPPSPADVRGLLDLAETREWMLPPEAFEGRREEIAEAGRSRLVLEGRDPEERIRDTIGRILEEFLGEEEREAWALRLLDLALVLNESGRQGVGATAAILAADLGAARRSPIGEAFLWALGSRTLGIVGGDQPPAEGRPADGEEGSGILTP